MENPWSSAVIYSIYIVVLTGHSRKLQRDMILRPDEGTNLEDSDEDNPETIKTIREQFKKMDNKAPVATPFVPQAAPPQVVSSQVKFRNYKVSNVTHSMQLVIFRHLHNISLSPRPF